jgi:enoyl-CoA hydratase/carnithine racemase
MTTSDEPSQALRSETRDKVRVISLNRPHRHNAFDDALYEALCRATADAVDDPGVRAILLRGEGTSFSSGRDTASLGLHGAAGDFAFLHAAQEVNLRLRSCRVPVVAVLKGAVFGKALEIALAADFRVAAPSARLSFPEVEFGLFTDNGGAAHAARLAGPSRAKYLLMSGDRIDAQTSLSWGLVDWLVPVDEVDDYGLDLAARLAARAPLPVALAKELVNQFDDAAIAIGFRSERLAQLALFHTADYREAKLARTERRAARFTGQ